ncbi:siderophore-interacting protein [Pseudomonas purpurea]|uniref:siderophore-interacting protein n=1 Tax=Pseudomonas purpurea TaxID=3136737 RepID=UPI00326479B5
MARAAPYTVFDAVLQRKQLLSPHLMRVTLAGPRVADMATWAPDQRVKLFFPAADGTPANLPRNDNWHADYRSIPVAQRPAMRTYTIRHLRTERCEVDIDFVLHGETGPASYWAIHAKPGAGIQIVAPDRQFTAVETGGFEWKPPRALKYLLLMADPTALPAALGILDELAALAEPPRAQVLFEIESADDKLPTPIWQGLSLQWLIRDQAPGAQAGTLMAAALRALDLSAFAVDAAAQAALAEVNIDEELLWETPRPNGNGFYGWIAGETAAVMDVRKYLIKECGIPHEMLNLMGYWRYNRVGG